MKKKLLVTIIILAVIGGGLTTWYVYNNIVNEKAAVTVEQTDTSSKPKQTETSETEATTTEPEILASGKFVDGDAVHHGEGTAQIVRENGEVRLEFRDFSVTAGPDVFVYLSPNAAGEDLGEFASLGPIKSSSGDQSYSLPENYQDYKTVVIWCRAFSVTFATAELEVN